MQIARSIVVVTGLICGTLHAAERPRIGLVLSGGGARGAAHVGVLKVLEDMRVPVDAIAGTSMGAVIGGLYAAGYDADDLAELIDRIDWGDHLIDDPPRPALSFRRKQDDRDFLIDFDVGLGADGVELPLGLVQGQKMNLLLKAQTLPVEHIDDFDELPIPFRAVATDIETGRPVTLADGDLATALRASMAVPGAFAPVEYQGRVLVDGGVSNNLPIDIARAMGADVLIVVDIQFPLLSRDQLRSALDITGQLLTILVVRESQTQLDTLDPDDIVIKPELGNMGSADFDRAPQAIAAGAAAAREQSATLQRLSVSATEFDAWLAAREQRHRTPRIDYVRLASGASVWREALTEQLGIDAGPLDLDTLNAGISELYGLGLFGLIDYELVEDGSETGLLVTANEKSWGPNYLNLGARLEDDLDGTSRYTIAARYTRTAINRRGGEWRTDLRIGTNPGLFSEFYQPLDRGWHYFFAPRIELQRFNVDVFADDQRIASQLVSSSSAGIEFGRTLGNWGELRLGLGRTSGRISPRIGDFEPKPDSFDTGSLIARFAVDTLDDPNFPRSGWQSNLAWAGARDALGSDASNDRITANTLWATSRGPRTWILAGRAGSNLRGDGLVQDAFELGGLFRLSGIRNGQLRGQHFAMLDVVHYRRVNTSKLFDVPIYAGASLELGNVWNDSSAIGLDNTLLAGSLFVGMDTFVGPIYLAYGFAEGGQTAAYFLLGQGFE